MIYSIPYLLLLLCYLFFAIIEYKYKNNYNIYKIVIFLCSVIYILFFGLRGFIGWDWTNYYILYQRIPDLFNITSFSSSNFEWGFIIYTSLFKTISLDYHAFVFFNTVIHIILLNVFINRYLPPGYHIFGLIIFIVMHGLTMEVDTMRNIMSVLLFLLSLKYIEERKIGKYYILNGLGVLFHISSVFFLPLYFFLHRKINRKLMVLIFLFGLMLFFLKIEYIRSFVLFIAQILGGKIEQMTRGYLNSPIYGKAYGFSIGLLERLFSMVLIIVYYKKLINASKQNVIFINVFVIYFIFFFYFSEISIISIRVGMLFIFAYWILWPSIIHVSKIKINRQFIICIMMIYVGAKMIGLTGYQLYQYDNLMFGIRTYEERKEVFDAIAKDILEGKR